MQASHVKTFDVGRGFGFIEGGADGDIFFHHSGINRHWQNSPTGDYALTGETVTLSELEETERGLRANSVTVISLRHLVCAKVVARPTQREVNVEFPWLGEQHTRTIMTKHIIAGFSDTQPQNLMPGDWILATAYTNYKGNIAIGRGCVYTNPGQCNIADEVNRDGTPPKTTRDCEGRITTIRSRPVVAGGYSHPNPIILSIPWTIAGRGQRCRPSIARVHLIDGLWYATLPNRDI